MQVTILVGKLMFCAIFVLGGLQKLLTNDGFTHTLNIATRSLARAGLPQALATIGISHATFNSLMFSLVFAFALLELMGGIALICGGALCGSVMLMIFLVLVTPFAHYPIDGSGHIDATEKVQIMKNLALLGALLLIFAYEYERKFSAATPETPPVRNSKKND